MLADSPPLIPKTPGGPLRVIVIGRLSKVAGYFDGAYDGQIVLRTYPTTSGGTLRRRRQAMREILPLLRAGDTDLVVAAQANCIAPDPWSQFEFAEEMSRLGTRVIFVKDGIDTALETWPLRQQIVSLAQRIRRVKRE